MKKFNFLKRRLFAFCFAGVVLLSYAGAQGAEGTSIYDAQVKKSKKAKVPEDKTSKPVTELISDEGAFQSKSVEHTVGAIKLLLKGAIGSFQFYSVNEANSAIPLLSGYDEFTSSFFSLKAGKKEYKLTNNIGIVIGARKNGNGAQMVYIIPEIARVFVKFDCLKSVDTEDADIIRVAVTVKNRGKRTESFALKNVLDTYLGEQRGPHFTTADEQFINSEVQYRKFDKVKYIYSSNQKAGVQVMLYGGDVTRPEVVSISNKDLLTLPNWIPPVVRSRAFDSVLSYNNSALCINWEECRLEPDAEQTYVYYLAVSSDGKKPRGEEYLEKIAVRDDKLIGESAKNYNMDFDESYELALSFYREREFEDSYQIVLLMWQNPDFRVPRLAELKEKLELHLGLTSQRPYVSPVDQFEKAAEQEMKNRPQYPVAGVTEMSSVAVPEKNDYEPEVQGIPSDTIKTSGAVMKKNVPFDVDSISNEKLNSKYIQGLLDRINALEADDENIDRSEIYRLNAELDAILEKLRSN